MNGYKYILLDETELDQFEIYTFPPWLNHADVARKFYPREPVSAGFIRIVTERDGTPVKGRMFETYGRSDSLNLESSKQDADFLNT